ncbi:hypothetical protein CRG98_017151, partial [Punica granatum]
TPSMLAWASYNLAGSAPPCEFTSLIRKFVEPARCSSSLLAGASYNLAGSAPPCEFTSLIRKFVEPARWCLIQSCRVCSPVRVYFSDSEVRRACSLVPHTILPGLLPRASLLFCFASTPILLARASCNLAGSAHPCEFTSLLRKFAEPARWCLIQFAGSAHPCEFTFLLRKYADPARSCLIQSCLVCSPVRVYFSASQVHRACSLVPLATLPGMLTRASLLFCFASSPSLLARASCNLARYAHPCEFTFLLRKFTEPARSCLLQPCQVCSPVRVYFSASQVHRACSLVPLATLPGMLTRASLLFCFASSPSLLARASCNLARYAHPCEFTFLLRKFTEPARSCLLQPCQVCSPVRVYFSASQVHRACSLVPLATLPGMLTRASLLFCFASSPSLLARASCNLARYAHPCEFTFLLRKFTEPARSCLLQPCQVCSPVRVYFSASQVHRACSLVPLATLPGMLTRASLLFCFASSPSLLARASCNLARYAHPCEFTFLLRKFTEPARSCLLQPCQVCSPVRVYFSASQVHRACSLVPLATLPGMLTRASLLFCFASSPSLLARASCNLARYAHPCEFTFLLRKFTEPARSCLLQPCQVCSPVRVYFSASQVHRACSLVPLATLPGMLTRASLLFCFASSPSLLARASCNLARYAHPCEFTFLLRKFTEPARSCLLQPCQVCSPVRVYFSASQVHRACSLVPLATLPGMLTRASLLFCFASSPSLLARASCNLARYAHPCEFTFLLRKFTEPARSCLLQPCQVCSPVRVYFSASQVHRACSLVPLATLPGMLTRASLLFCFASSPSLLARASCNLARYAHPCEFTFLLRKFTEPARSCLLQPCQVCSPVRVYFSASQVHRACSLVPLATLPGMLTRASLLFCFASSPSLLARASCNLASTPILLARASYNLAGSAHPYEFTFLLRKYADPARSCLLQPCRVCSPVRVYFSASQVRRACSLVPHTILPGLLTRASLLFYFPSLPSLLARAACNLAWSAHQCEFTFRLRKFAEPTRSCLLQPCRVCSPVRVYFSASEVRRACSLVPHTILPGLLTNASLLFCFASTPILLARASYNLAWSAHPCEFTFLLPKFAESARSCRLQPCLYADPARSCLIQSCLVCSPVRVYFSTSQVRRVCSLVPLATLPGLLTSASLLFGFASSPSLLAHAYCNLAGSAHPCEFTSLLRKFAEPARLCLIQSCRVCSLMRVYFSASQFAEPTRSCLLQPCRVCSPVRVYFSASEVRRACSLVPHTILPGLLTNASLLFCFASTPILLARASYNLAWSAHPCEFTFLLPKFAESARSCRLQPCLVCSPVRVYFSASLVRRAYSLMPIATLPGLLTRASLLLCFGSSPSLLACASYNLAGASLLFGFASSPSLLAHAYCNLAGSAHPCEFTSLLRKFAEPARLCLIQSCRVCSLMRVYFSASQFAEPTRSCLLQPCRVCSPVRVYFSASEVRRACSLVPHTILPGLLTNASLLFCFASTPILLARASYNLAWSAHPCEFTFLLPKFAESARSCRLQPCLLRKFAEPARLCLIHCCRVCSPVRVYFYASQVHRACSLVPHTILPGLLPRASLLFCFASSPSLLVPAYCNLAGSAHPCEFTFRLRKFAEPARSCLLQPCWICSLACVYFSASQVRRACSFLPIATLPGLLTRASLLSSFASSPSLLARASCNLAWSTHLCQFTFRLRKFAEPTRSCLLQPCRVCSPLRKFAEPARSCLLQPCLVYSPVPIYFSASQVRRAYSLMPIATLPGLLTRASLLSSFASSPSLLARASCNLAWSTHLCQFTFRLRKFAEPTRSCLLQPCRVCSPLRKFAEPARSCLLQPCLVYSPVPIYFSASQVRRAYSLMPIATLPGLLTRASLLSSFASSPSLLARASCNLAWSTHLCQFTFRLRKFAEPTRSCLLQPCRVCSPLRKFAEPARSCLLQPCLVYSPVPIYFSASQVRRAYSLMPIATLPGLLTRASLLSSFASSPSLLARASCNLARYAHPCEFTFLLRKFTEPARSCLLQTCQVCPPVGVYFSASQVRRSCSLVHPATLPGLLTRASLLLCFGSSPSLLAGASYNLAGSAHPCEFTSLLRKFAEPARWCLIQSCRVCSLMRVYFSASQVRRSCSLVPHTILPGLLTRASLLFCFASSPSLLASASYNLAGSAHPCEFTFLLPKFAESARSCLLQPCLVYSPVRIYFSASQVRRAYSLIPIATLPGLLTRASLHFGFASSPSLLARASCNHVGSAHMCEFTFLLRKFTELARSCLLQPCQGLLTRASLLSSFASSPSLLACASYFVAGSAHPYAEHSRLGLIQSCRVCSPVRVYFSASQVRRAFSLGPHTILPGLLTHASLLFCFASTPILLARASYNLAWSAHPCEFTFLLRRYAEHSRLGLIQSCRVCSPVRVYFSASQVRRAFSLGPHTILPGLLTRASLLFYFPSSPSLLARASCNLALSAHLCEFTFRLLKFAEPARSCLLQPCRVCSPVRVRRAFSLGPHTILPGLLTHASLLFCFASTPILLARASYNLAWSAHPCEFTFLLRRYAEHSRLGLIQSCRVCSPVRVYFSTSQVRRVCSLVPLATLPGLLTSASLLFGFASSPSLLAHAYCNLAGSAHPCEFTFRLRKFAEPARSCLLQPCWICSLVRVYFSDSQVRQACSLVPLATLPGNPDYFPAPGSVPVGSIPTTFLHRDQSPSGNPDYFPAPGSVPVGSIPTTFLHRDQSPSGNPDYFPAPGSVPVGSIPTTFLHRDQSPSGNPDYFPAPGSVPVGSIPTTFLHRDQSPSGNPDYFPAPGSVPVGSIPTTFLHRDQSPSGNPDYFPAPGSVPVGSIPTTFLHRDQSPSGNPDYFPAPGSVPVGSIPTTFLHRDQSPSGNPDYFPAPGSVPVGSIPTTFLHRDQSPSGNPDYFPAPGSVPVGSIPTTFLHRDQSPSGNPDYFPAPGSVPVGSIPTTFLHRDQSPSGNPDYFPAPGSVPVGSIPTTFLHRDQSPSGNPDYFPAPGSVPVGSIPTTFLHRDQSPSGNPDYFPAPGSVPVGSIPTTFLHRDQSPSGNPDYFPAPGSVPVGSIPTTFLHRDQSPSGNPDYFPAPGSVPVGSIPTTFLHRDQSPSGNPDYFPAPGSVPVGSIPTTFLHRDQSPSGNPDYFPAPGSVPVGSIPTTFLHRDQSPSGNPDYFPAPGSVPVGSIPTTFLHRDQSPSGNPDYFPAPGSVPVGSIPTTFLHRDQSPSGNPDYFPAPGSVPVGSIPTTFLHRDQSPSGNPDYFPAPGSVPVGSIPTTFLHRDQSPSGNPDYFPAPGSVPVGSIPTTFLHRDQSPSGNPDYFPAPGSVPVGSIPTTFLHRDQSPSGNPDYFPAPGSVPVGSIPTTFLHRDQSPSGNPDYFPAPGSVPVGSIPTTFLHRDQSPSGNPDYFPAPGSVPVGSIPTTFLHRDQSPFGNPDYFPAPGLVPFGSIPTTFLHRDLSRSGQSRLLSCTEISPLRAIPTTFLHR